MCHLFRMLGYILIAVCIGIILTYLLPAWLLAILLALLLGFVGFLIVKKR